MSQSEITSFNPEQCTVALTLLESADVMVEFSLSVWLALHSQLIFPYSRHSKQLSINVDFWNKK